MNDRPELHDRVTGALVQVPDALILLGRYRIPEQGYAINGVSLSSGAYLAAGTGRWALRRSATRWSLDAGVAPLPAPIVMESVAVIAGQAEKRILERAPLDSWMSISPLVNAVDERLRRDQLENHLRKELSYLKAICHDPHARLRTQDILLPISKVRRITWRSVVYLAAHSETWAARRLHGVEPARLLTPIKVADYDLYENRVVATLLDRLWQYVLRRIADLAAIDSLAGRAQDMMKQVEKRPDFRERHRLYEFIAELLKTDDLFGRIEQRRRELSALRSALAPLLASELRSGVRGPYTGPLQLRRTNLFENEVNYRHCRQLWTVEVASRQGADGLADPVDALAEWCRNFALYVLVIVLRALNQLGLTPSSGDGPRVGPPGLTYTYRSHAVRLDLNDDDTFTFLLDGESVLRVVPIPHALTSRSDLAEVDRILDGLRSTNGDPTAVLYPGERGEREALPLDRRLAMHRSFATAHAPAMVPVSPADLGSIGRMARVMRGAFDLRIMTDYPVRVESRVARVDTLAGRFDWLAWRNGQLLGIRPPQPHELASLDTTLAELRTRADPARQQADNLDELNRLSACLRAAANQLTKLLCCPVCLRQGPVKTFTVRNGDTYHCRCPYCPTRTDWEIRWCVSCKRHYPVLIVANLAEEPGGDGDTLDEKFSQDLLAAPCWHDARSYICSLCGYCPESPKRDCDHCILGRPSAADTSCQDVSAR